MPNATVISKNELTPNMLKLKYNIPSVAATSGDSGEYELSISPFTLGSIESFYIVNAGTSFTVSLSDVSGGTQTPSIDEILRVINTDKSYNENNLGIIFNNANSLLYCRVQNTSAIATGISTISMIVRR